MFTEIMRLLYLMLQLTNIFIVKGKNRLIVRRIFNFKNRAYVG